MACLEPHHLNVDSTRLVPKLVSSSTTGGK